MARYKYQGTARDGNGRVIPECTITVYLAGGTTLATCYEVETGGSAISGSQITASSTGVFSFWVDDGDYASTQKFKVAISKANFNSVTYDSIGIIQSDTNDKVAVNSSGTAGYLIDVISAGDGITVSESGGVAVVAVGASVLQTDNIDTVGGPQSYDPTILKEADLGVTAGDYVFSLKGDLIYASAAGSKASSRLAIGAEGQVLTVSSNATPYWADSGGGNTGGMWEYVSKSNPSGVMLVEFTGLSGDDYDYIIKGRGVLTGSASNDTLSLVLGYGSTTYITSGYSWQNEIKTFTADPTYAYGTAAASITVDDRLNSGNPVRFDLEIVGLESTEDHLIRGPVDNAEGSHIDLFGLNSTAQEITAIKLSVASYTITGGTIELWRREKK